MIKQFAELLPTAQYVTNIIGFSNPDFRRMTPLNQRQKRKRWRQNPNSKFARRKN